MADTILVSSPSPSILVEVRPTGAVEIWLNRPERLNALNHEMRTLLAVVRRSSGNLFDVENFLARESVGDQGADPDMPPVAGGAL